MRIKLAINGYGRIGRCVLRALYESDIYRNQIQIVAINELSDLDTIAHLTKYDSTHGRFQGSVEKTVDGLVVNGDRIAVYHHESPRELPWKDLGIDLVHECTGVFQNRNTTMVHIQQGAKKVLYSHPADGDVDATIVFGVNQDLLRSEHQIISNASCTTNCVIPILHILNQQLGIVQGTCTTIHAAMHDQPVIDAYNRDPRKTRSAIRSIIPVSTELHKGIERIMPSLKGKFETLAIRVPTVNVSLMDLNVLVGQDTTAEAVNHLLIESSRDGLGGVLGYSAEPLVSCDFNHDSRSAIVDGDQTRVSGTRLVKILTWFDNEWGFANRMLDTTIAAMSS